MKDEARVRTAVERNVKALTLRPTLGVGTAVTRAQLRDGLRCEIEEGPWKLTADLGEKSGGSNAACFYRALPGGYGLRDPR